MLKVKLRLESDGNSCASFSDGSKEQLCENKQIDSIMDHTGADAQQAPAQTNLHEAQGQNGVNLIDKLKN